jgi:hypothetical protein
MLTHPRFYTWVPDTDSSRAQPFVEAETLRGAMSGPRRCLIAGDEHRIPFPRRVLNSDRYLHASSCRVGLFVVEGGYPDADYLMEIHLAGESHTAELVAEIVHRAVGTTGHHGVRMGGPALMSPVAAGVQAAASILLTPAPLAGESHWTQQVELATGPARVRYDYMP